MLNKNNSESETYCPTFYLHLYKKYIKYFLRILLWCLIGVRLEVQYFFFNFAIVHLDLELCVGYDLMSYFNLNISYLKLL